MAILAGAFLAALAIRRVLGAERVRARRAEINGVNVIALFVFVAAIMESVGQTLLAGPLLVLGLIALCFAVFGVLLALTCLVFARAGCARALAMGFAASQRNMGLMPAATGGAVPELTWLYFALAQFPIYLAPQLLAPVARHVLDREKNEKAKAGCRNSESILTERFCVKIKRRPAGRIRRYGQGPSRQ